MKFVSVSGVMTVTVTELFLIKLMITKIGWN